MNEGKLEDIIKEGFVKIKHFSSFDITVYEKGNVRAYLRDNKEYLERTIK